MPLVAFDIETRLFVPGLMTPPIVCASIAAESFDALKRALETVPVEHLRFDGARAVVWGEASVLAVARALLEDQSVTICGANIAFDFSCLCAAEPTLTPLVFDAYDKSRVLDVLLCGKLHLIALGMLGRNPKTGDVWKSPKTGRVSDRLSLEIACDIFLNRSDAKEQDFWRLRYAWLECVPLSEWPDDAWQYPIADAQNTLDLASFFVAGALAGTVYNLHDQPSQARAAFALQIGSLWGFKTDPETVSQFKNKHEKALSEEVEKFEAIGFFNKGKVNSQAIKARVIKAYSADEPALCGRCGGTGKALSEKSGNAVICKASAGGCDGSGLYAADSVPRTATGGIASDRDTLSESGDTDLEAYAGVSETRKLLNTYLPFLETGTRAPIIPQCDSLLASGRVSYQGLIQLMPRGHSVRDNFVASPGWLYSSVDYGTVELRTLAQCLLWIVSWSNMAESLNSGRDLHTDFAASMLGISYEEITARLTAKDKEAKSFRQAAKPCNFGFPGGMGTVTFVLTNRKTGIRFCQILEGAETCGAERVSEWRGRACVPTCAACLRLAEDLRAQWFSKWPEMRQYLKFVSEQTNATGELTQFVSERIRGALSYCDGANTLFQGLAADGAKAAFYAVVRDSYANKDSVLYGHCKPLTLIHDEIFSEILESKGDPISREIERIMIREMRRYTPDIEITAEAALMRRWYKAAERVEIDGVIVPWEPEQ